MKSRIPRTLLTSLSAILAFGSDVFEFDLLEIFTTPACLLLCVVAVLLSAVPAVHADTPIVIVATNGTPAPEGNGTLRMTISISPNVLPVVINDAGQVTFATPLNGTLGGSNASGIYRGDSTAGNLINLVREGQSAPDSNGVFGVVNPPNPLAPRATLNSAGQGAFYADLSNTIGGTNNSGLFRSSGGVVTQIVRKGWVCPDGNGRYDTFPIQPAFNTSGQVAFYSGLTGSTGGINQNQGIFLGDGTTLTQIARNGYSYGPFGTFGPLGTPSLNDSGQVAFSVGGAQATTGVYRVSGITMTKIAYQYESAPDGNGYLVPSSFSDVALNNAGQVGFSENVGSTVGNSNRFGIFRGDGNTLTQIVRTDWPVPDGNGRFGYDGSCIACPHPWFMNDSGQIVFSAGLSGTGASTNDSGIYRGDGITLKKIAREGEPAPDSNATFGPLIVHDDANLSVAMNNSGQVALFAGLSNGVRGIYFYDDKLGLIKVISTGDLLQNKTVTTLMFKSYWTLGNEGSDLNSRGQVAFGFACTNAGTTNYGIAIWSGPELRITDIRTVANDVRLTWNTFAGKTNFVQATPGGPDGSYTNNFTDLASNIVVSGVGQVSTNWLDNSGATNFPARYYRVRLVP